jgi:hypothetical protein
LAVFVTVKCVERNNFWGAFENHAAKDVVLEVFTDGRIVDNAVDTCFGENFWVSDSGELEYLRCLHNASTEVDFSGCVDNKFLAVVRKFNSSG